MRATGAEAGRPRVLYIQYANPAAYPPALHAIALLAEAGATVQVLGLDTLNGQLALPYPAGVAVDLHPAQRPGWRQKVGYARFARAAWRLAAGFSPDWVYVSDPLAAPVAALVARVHTTRLVYHEHDAPAEAWQPERASWFMRRVLQARRAIGRRADVCVMPNATRAEVFRALTGRAETTVVWNCPRRHEAEVAIRRPGAGLRVLYHGSIVPARLPLAVVDALAFLPADVELVIAGYETAAHPGYVAALVERARQRGAEGRVTYAGVLNRPALLSLCRTCDVGLVMFAAGTSDPNEATMVGASNKAFEYLACGLSLVVGPDAEWRDVFEGAGVAVSCDPADPGSIATALGRFHADPALRQAMGERGRQLVLSAWNYDRCFAPVLDVMTTARS